MTKDDYDVARRRRETILVARTEAAHENEDDDARRRAEAAETVRIEKVIEARTGVSMSGFSVQARRLLIMAEQGAEALVPKKSAHQVLSAEFARTRVQRLREDGTLNAVVPPDPEPRGDVVGADLLLIEDAVSVNNSKKGNRAVLDVIMRNRESLRGLLSGSFTTGSVRPKSLSSLAAEKVLRTKTTRNRAALQIINDLAGVFPDPPQPTGGLAGVFPNPSPTSNAAESIRKMEKHFGPALSSTTENLRKAKLIAEQHDQKYTGQYKVPRVYIPPPKWIKRAWAGLHWPAWTVRSYAHAKSYFVMS